MPWSSDEGKGWMLDRIRWHAAQPQAAPLSIPLGEYPQGECEGNPHEAHLVTWTHVDVCEQLSGVTEGSFSVTSSMGCYEAPAAGR
jgi:hypothetical protein